MITRRGMLAYAAGVVSGGVGAAAYSGQLPNEVEAVVNETVGAGATDPYHQEFPSGLVSSIKFNGLGEMTVTFRSGHDAVCFAIWHRVDNIQNRDTVYNHGCGLADADMPRYGGEVVIDIVGAIKSSGVTFPTPYFKLIGFDQEMFGARAGTVEFTVPRKLMPEESLVG